MRILGYGEDALTYWAISKYLPKIIGHSQLKDKSNEDDSLFIYRPSFGRRGGSESAQFGEFDAIIGTPKAVYLVESKWTGETIINGQVVLAGRQILRHQIFRWILNRWREQPPESWENFYDNNHEEFQDNFNGKPLAPSESRLAGNLQAVLKELSGYGEDIRDVLLYFHLKDDPIPNGVAACDDCKFTVVPFPYRPIDHEAGLIIDMHAGQ